MASGMESVGNVVPEVKAVENLQTNMAGMIEAAHQLLDGRSTPEECAHMLDIQADYRQALTGVAEYFTNMDMQIYPDETRSRDHLINFLTLNAKDILSEAAYQHNRSSKVERTNFFFEQGKFRRKAALAVIGLASGSTVPLAVKGMQTIPGFEEVYGVGVGVGFMGIASRFIKMRTLINSAMRLPINRLKHQATHGLQHYDYEILKGAIAAEGLRDMPDKEAAKKRIYELMIEDFEIPDVRSKLWLAIGADKLETPEQRQETIKKAVDTSVDWLLGFYGLKVKAETPDGEEHFRPIEQAKEKSS